MFGNPKALQFTLGVILMVLGAVAVVIADKTKGNERIVKKGGIILLVLGVAVCLVP